MKHYKSNEIEMVNLFIYHKTVPYNLSHYYCYYYRLYFILTFCKYTHEGV